MLRSCDVDDSMALSQRGGAKAFQPTLAVLGYLLVALFFLIPLGAFRMTCAARSTLPPT